MPDDNLLRDHLLESREVDSIDQSEITGALLFLYDPSAPAGKRAVPITPDRPLPVVGLGGVGGAATDPDSAREATQKQVADALATLLTYTNGLEGGLGLIQQALAGTLTVSAASLPLPAGAATQAGVEAVRALLAAALTVQGTVNVGNLPATQPISAASLPLPAGAATQAGVEALRVLLAGTLSTRAVTLPARQSVIRTITGNANTALVLKDHELAPLFADCTVLNLRNSGTADLLVYNAVGGDSALHFYPLPAGQSVSADLRLADLTVFSTAAVKLSLWGGREAT